MSRNRYGAWDGGPDPLAAPYDVRAAVDQVGRDVLAGRGVRDALNDLLRRGPDGRRGLDELTARAMRARREALRRGNLGGAVTRAQHLLDQAVATERDALAPRTDMDADFARSMLDNLPRSTAQAVRELEGYRWESPEAAALYNQILDGLRQDVMEQRFRGMKEAASDPAAREAMAGMMHDLNDLLARHARNEDVTDRFADFMNKHGDYFPENPQNVDELIDVLGRRFAAGERLMRSLSERQRQELADLMDQAFQGPLGSEMAELGDNLRALRPGLSWGGAVQTRGNAELGYGQATGALEEISDLDALLDQLGQDRPGATLDDVDVEAVERTLGNQAAEDVRRLQELERELRRQGWVTRTGEGLTLSPKALRRLGGTALNSIFADLGRGRQGQHDLAMAGAAGEITGASRPWQFGDTQPLDVVRTVSRAVLRNGPHTPVRLEVDDFEVVETERRTSAAVALCVDLSVSMVLEDRWGPMKQTALALAHLIATRYPQDALQIIGFGRSAATMTDVELAGAEPDWDKGTNLQHALQLAGRHLRKHSDGEPVVLVVTDGEPTSHNTPDGPYFSWPPVRETIEATVVEVDHLTRYGASLNLFMLGEDPGLRRFVDAIARRSGGRVFTPSAEDLGRYVISDYIRARRGR
ncbi:vWA domain-containing protein [Hamadaea tsunoensis]|uniref:vWA domain-containing protein n=1 Tax=Hamadaea tsunoensis TaxID=53368 RepID=UPI0003FFC4AF|nr:VWA domain-containing protein [Hamadaea tsunoensis]